MSRFLPTVCTLLWLPVAALGQSPDPTLPSFNLGDDVAPPTTESEMRDCLKTDGTCESDEYRTAKPFTLDDVMNLGVEIRVPKDVSKTATLPTIDLEILFAYNSDELTPEAKQKLSSLSNALRDPQLDGSTLLFIGHTDNVGSAAYNEALSLRRARSVADYVQATLGLPSSRISTAGKGFRDLKNSLDPASAQNRRVQLVLVPGS